MNQLTDFKIDYFDYRTAACPASYEGAGMREILNETIGKRTELKRRLKPTWYASLSSSRAHLPMSSGSRPLRDHVWNHIQLYTIYMTTASADETDPSTKSAAFPLSSSLFITCNQFQHHSWRHHAFLLSSRKQIRKIKEALGTCKLSDSSNDI